MVLADTGFSGWLTTAFPDVSSNLAAAAIGGVMVWIVSRAIRWLRLFRARRFWRAMAGRRPLIVLGAPEEKALSSWEKSGMVGKGDILALVAIDAELRRLGFVGRIVEAKELSEEDHESDLILIGGPDGNSATATMLENLEDVISFGFEKSEGDEASPLCDKRNKKKFVPTNNKRGNPRNDYGLIIRAANPLAPDTAEIVIVAGCWGYGTTAAARKLGDKKFLREQRHLKHFEAVVETTVARGAHYTKVLDSREIRQATAD